MFEKTKLTTKPGSNILFLKFVPKLTQAQIETALKQKFKRTVGGLSEHWLKNKNINRTYCLDTLIVELNYALNIFHARQLIKNKQVSVNHKTITSSHYIVKPFSTIVITNFFQELTFLKLITQNKLKNNLNFIYSFPSFIIKNKPLKQTVNRLSLARTLNSI